MSTSDLQAFQDELLTMYNTLSSEGFTNEMAAAFATAELAGRFDVQQEVNHE